MAAEEAKGGVAIGLLVAVIMVCLGYALINHDKRIEVCAVRPCPSPSATVTR